MTETARSTPDYSFKLKPTRRALPWNYVITGNGMRPNGYHEVPVLQFHFPAREHVQKCQRIGKHAANHIAESEREEQEANERIAEMAQTLLPGVVLTKPIMAYSGGQRQRFAFIRALAKPHRVLLADEPTGNLDPLKAQKAMGMTKTVVKEKNTAAVIVSHDIQLALKNADCIILIEKPLDADGNPAAGQIEPSTVFRKRRINGRVAIPNSPVNS